MGALYFGGVSVLQAFSLSSTNQSYEVAANVALMGCHFLESSLLKAIAKCAPFSGDPSLKGNILIKYFMEQLRLF